jgi:hypothetical protein
MEGEAVMSTNAKRISMTMAMVAVSLFAAEARATSSLYSSQCASCHSATVTSCDGCHAHGAHSTSSKNDINITGKTDKTSYLPGETVKVTVNGGYKNAWVRTALFDQTLKQIALTSCPGGQGGCTTSVYPTSMTAPAPTTPGSYVWAVGWYGHKYDITGASFGSGNSTALKIGYFTPDTGNANHGYQTVAVSAFTVTASAAPAIALNPASLAFPSVAVGSSQTLAAQVQNVGTATLNVTTVSRCVGTPTSITWSPTTAFTVASGTSAPLNVTFAPTATGALPAGACLTIASNDPAKPATTLGLTGTGALAPTPAIVLNPASIDFLTVVAGATKTLATQVQNTGTATLNVTSVSRCAGTPTSINWTPTAAFTVAAGMSAPLNVTFAPAVAGALPAGACLTIASNDPAKPATTLSLAGTGTAAPTPAIALNPASLVFSSVAIGSSQTLAAQVQNTGTATLNVTTVSRCVGTPTSITWTPVAAFTVAAGATAPLNVTFAPTVTGALPAGTCLSIASNDPAKPAVTLGLSGTGISAGAPAIALNPTSLNFQTVTVGTSRTLAAQVQNTGTVTLNVTAVSACAGTPTSITWTPATLAVAAGASAPLNVTFAATAAGALPAGACLSIVSNDPAQPTVTLGLSGTAAAPAPAIALNPASLAFASVAVGSSQTLTTQVQNTGTAPLSVASVSRCAGTPTSITWTPTAAFTVAAGTSAPLNVTFAPTATGALPAGACLTIASNDPAKPAVSLGLSGTGAPAPAPAMVLTPASLDFLTVVGTSQTLAAQVQNIGTASLSVTTIARCAGTPTSITWTPATLTVAAGLGAPLNITFTPTAAGTLPAGACLTLTSNDPAKPSTTLGLTGTATPAPVPAIALNPASLDFQTVAGSSLTLTIQVQNTGTATLNVTSVTRCAGTPTSITWTPTAAFTVGAGSSAGLNVKFAPATAGALPAGACLSLASNDPGKPVTTLGLTGTATAAGPAIAVNPASLDFQSVTAGASKTLAVTVQSVGTAALGVTGISPCAGTPSSITWTPAAPFTVPASSSAVLGITFAPLAAGVLPDGACLSIASNDPARPAFTVSLVGIATALSVPAVTLEPGTLDFRTAAVGRPSTLVAMLHNTGDAPLDVTSIGRCDGTPATVAWSASVPVSIAPGGSTAVTVLYVPTATDSLPPGSCLEIGTSDPARSIVDLALLGSATMTGSSDNPPAWGCATGGSGSALLGLLALVFASRRRKRARSTGVAAGGFEPPTYGL